MNRPMLGYFLTGRNDRQEIYIFHGEGANGKSTLLSMVQHVLGAHFRTMVPESLFEGNSAKSGYDIASLRGARLAVAQEAESSMKLYGSLIKQIRGGDTLKARDLQRPLRNGTYQKVGPGLQQTADLDVYDEALKRRIKLIPSIMWSRLSRGILVCWRS